MRKIPTPPKLPIPPKTDEQVTFEEIRNRYKASYLGALMGLVEKVCSMDDPDPALVSALEAPIYCLRDTYLSL